MNWYLIIYFFAGVLQDFIFTLNLRYVAQRKILLAMVTSFFTVVVNLVVLYNILTQLNSGKSILSIVIYALGIAVGTFLAMRLKIKS